MFRRLDPAADTVRFRYEGREFTARAGESVAAALLAAGESGLRVTPVSGALRAPYCLMGVCFDCLVEIDGTGNRQACLTPMTEGMQVRRHGVRSIP